MGKKYKFGNEVVHTKFAMQLLRELEKQQKNTFAYKFCHEKNDKHATIKCKSDMSSEGYVEFCTKCGLVMGTMSARSGSGIKNVRGSGFLPEEKEAQLEIDFKNKTITVRRKRRMQSPDVEKRKLLDKIEKLENKISTMYEG